MLWSMFFSQIKSLCMNYKRYLFSKYEKKRQAKICMTGTKDRLESICLKGGDYKSIGESIDKAPPMCGYMPSKHLYFVQANMYSR